MGYLDKDIIFRAVSVVFIHINSTVLGFNTYKNIYDGKPKLSTAM